MVEFVVFAELLARVTFLIGLLSYSSLRNSFVSRIVVLIACACAALRDCVSAKQEPSQRHGVVAPSLAFFEPIDHLFYSASNKIVYHEVREPRTRTVLCE